MWLITVKRQRVAELQQLALRGALTSQASAHPRSDKPPRPACLAFLDSTDRHGCPDLGSVYGLVGHQLKGRFARFGQSLVCPLRQPGLSVGKGVYTIHHRKRAAELLEHLQLLIDSKPNTFWFVVLDNASAHTTAAIEAFAFHHRARLELFYRPTYSPHLNLIERLWRFLRGQMTRNHFYVSLFALIEAVIDWLEHLPFAQFCSLMGLDESQLVIVQDPFS